MARLDRIEPLLPDEGVRENRMGMTEVLGWQGSPTANEHDEGPEVELEELSRGNAAVRFQIVSRLVPCQELDSGKPSTLWDVR